MTDRFPTAESRRVPGPVSVDGPTGTGPLGLLTRRIDQDMTRCGGQIGPAAASGRLPTNLTLGAVAIPKRAPFWVSARIGSPRPLDPERVCPFS